MKIYPFISSGLTLLLGWITFGVESVRGQEAAPATEAAAVVEGVQLGADQLEELVGPIALYPDALIALILPASTVSSDVVLAARFLNSGGTVTQIDAQPWEQSVKGLAHYPDVVKWMDENLSWTQRLGEAYLLQPQAVMDAIQRARAMARANGVLVDTPQQRVVVEENNIRIIPAQPDVIYVPRYDPEIIYVQRPLYYYPDPWVTFGIGFGVGSWLAYDCDWHTRAIWVNPHHHHHWGHHRDWRHRPSPGRPGYVHHNSGWHEWKPPHHHNRPHRDGRRWSGEQVRPAPLHGAPRFDRERWQRRDRDSYVSGGGRPGVVRPSVTRERVPGSDAAERSEWDNLRRERDPQTRTDRYGSGGFRRLNPGSVGNNAAAVPSQAAPAQVTPGAAAPSTEARPVQPPSMAQRGFRDATTGRDGQRRFERRGNNPVASPPSDRRFQPPQVATPPAGVASQDRGQGERRRGPSERTSDRQIRPAPSIGQSGAVSPAPSQSVASPRPAPQQQRDFRPARIAQPSSPAAAPRATASAPAPAPTPAPAARSVEVREARNDGGPRPAASSGGGGGHRGGGGGRSSRDRSVER